MAPNGPPGQSLPVPGKPGTLGGRLGSDALGVHSNQWIRSFDEAYVHYFPNFYTNLAEPSGSRLSDINNERLPEFDPAAGDPSVTAPSMRQENREELIKKALEEDEDGDSVVERLADRIARGRKPQGRPRALKRFETA